MRAMVPEISKRAVAALGARSDVVSDRAVEYSRRQLPDRPDLQSQLAIAMTLLERSAGGASVARRLEEDGVQIVVDGVQPGFAGQYVGPFSGGTLGASIKATFTDSPWPHRILVEESMFDQPKVLAGLLAHEGAHYELGQQHLKHIPIRIGAGMLGALGMVGSLATLGIVDMTGNFHRPGYGALASVVQGSTLVTAMTHENYAYRRGDSVDRDLIGSTNSWVYDKDGHEESWARGGWNIASEYVPLTSYNITGGDRIEPPNPIRTAVATVGGLGLGLGIYTVLRKKFHLSDRMALLATLGPGAAATVVAGVQVQRGGGAMMGGGVQVK